MSVFLKVSLCHWLPGYLIKIIGSPTTFKKNKKSLLLLICIYLQIVVKIAESNITLSTVRNCLYQ